MRCLPLTDTDVEEAYEQHKLHVVMELTLLWGQGWGELKIKIYLIYGKCRMQMMEG